MPTHGGNAVSSDITRRSVVTHYCPRYCMPLFSETLAVRYFEHGGHWFTTSHYPDLDPLD